MRTCVRATCGECGDVELPIGSTLIVLEGDSEVLHFACPACGRPKSHSLTRRAAQLLVQAGVPVEEGPVNTVPFLQSHGS